MTGTDDNIVLEVQQLEEGYTSFEENENINLLMMSNIEQSTMRSEVNNDTQVNINRTSRFTSLSKSSEMNLVKSQKQRSKTPIKDVQLTDGRGPVTVIFSQ